MNPFVLFVLAVIAGIAVGYGYRGLLNRLLKKLQAPMFAHLTAVRDEINTVIADGEADVTKLKAKLQVAVARIEKVLPL